MLNNFMFSEKGRKTNIELIKSILEADGVRGMGRGLGVTVFREFVSCGIYFSTFVYFVIACI